MAEISKGLMRKTKAQLVEIILRKDEVERECRTEISNLNKKIKNYDVDIKGMAKQTIIDKSIIPKSYPKMFIMLNSLYSHIFNFSTFHQKLLPILHARHY